MSRSSILYALTSGVFALILSGCGPFDPFDVSLSDLNSKARDVMTYVAAERGDAASEGNLILGGGARDPKRRGSVSVRVSSVPVAAPVLAGMSIRTDGAAPATGIPTREHQATRVAASASYRILRGFQADGYRLLGIDLVGSVSIEPKYSGGDLQVTGGSGPHLGWGARLALIDGTPRYPSVTASVSNRNLGVLRIGSPTFVGAVGESGDFAVSSLKVDLRSSRLAIAHHFGQLGVTAGTGSDRFHYQGAQSVALDRPSGRVTGSSTIDAELTRTTRFAGASYPLLGLVVAAEIARHTGGPGAGATVNQFASRLGRARTSLTLGARLDW